MMVYKRKTSFSIGKWLLAIAIFIAAMTITWADVEGAPLQPGPTAPTQTVMQM